jgi:hypothetical protein
MMLHFIHSLAASLEAVVGHCINISFFLSIFLPVRV